MSASTYDHRLKAGNRGDLVKHPALVAVLDALLAESPSDPFTYADLFAGFSASPMLADGSWENGVGELIRRVARVDNRHIGWWIDRYLQPGDRGNQTTYPGSATLARDLIEERGRAARLLLWDNQEAPFLDLKAAFGPPPNRIEYGAASPTDPELETADLLFVDPPSLLGPDYLRQLLELGRPTLVWLPVFDKTEEDRHSDALSSVVLRWERGQGMVGCQLLLQGPLPCWAALQEATQRIADIMCWDYRIRGCEQRDQPGTDTYPRGAESSIGGLAT